MTKEVYMKKMDLFIDEFAGLEKFFRCLKEQTQQFKKKAGEKIPDSKGTYKNEAKEVVKKIVKA